MGGLTSENSSVKIRMRKLEFEYHSVRSRKGLINFLEEQGEKNILKKIGEDPQKWIEELGLIYQISTHSSIVAGQALFPPPENDPNFREIGNNTYFYDGEDSRFNGLWIREDYDKEMAESIGRNCEWMQYHTKLRAKLKINKEFVDIPFKEFLPENFEQKAERVEEGRKRPIWLFSFGDKRIYAKGSEIVVSKLYHPPSYRLTSFSSIHKATAEREMRTTEMLAEIGVNVPKIIGYYEADFEEFLFVEEVKGKQPLEFLDTHRQEIIRQDAEMLADLCKAGYRKCGFGDFDDKVFDGEKLWLIDVDECSDLYWLARPDFRKILLDPFQQDNLRRFRSMQREIFERVLKDTIYIYQRTLTPTDLDKEAYVKSFYPKLGWKVPGPRKMQDLLTFPEPYQTIDSYMSMMQDTD